MNESKNVVITREMSTPIQKVWDMWAVPENFQKWYGPEGASLPTVNMDVQVGGKRHFCMEMNTPNGPMQMWFVGEFIEITPVTKLVYTESMSNEAGEVVSPADMGMPGTDVTTITVELTDQGDTTKVVMTHAGVPADSPGAQGWEMALDKFESQLS